MMDPNEHEDTNSHRHDVGKKGRHSYPTTNERDETTTTTTTTTTATAAAAGRAAVAAAAAPTTTAAAASATAGPPARTGRTGPTQEATAATTARAAPVRAATDPAAPEAAPGALSTGDFRVGRVLGEGPFGTVRHCVFKGSHRHVAIKVVEKVALHKHPVFLRSLLNEQRVLRRLCTTSTACTTDPGAGGGGSHSPCSNLLVRLLASFDDRECAYLVLEYANCGTLQDYMDRQQQQQQQVLLDARRRGGNNKTRTASATSTEATAIQTQEIHSILRQIVQGIEYLHSRHRTVHGDLCPRNVLLHRGRDRRRAGDDGDPGPVQRRLQVKIADFGCAFRVVERNRNSNNNRNRNPDLSNDDDDDDNHSPIHDHHYGGTADYACPEILRGPDHVPLDRLTYGVDLWSLGCIAYAATRTEGNAGTARPAPEGDDDEDREDDHGGNGVLGCFGRSPFHAETDALAVRKILAYCDDNNGNNSRNGRIRYLFPVRDDPGPTDAAPDQQQPQQRQAQDGPFDAIDPTLATDGWKSEIAQLLDPDPIQRMKIWGDRARRRCGDDGEDEDDDDHHLRPPPDNTILRPTPPPEPEPEQPYWYRRAKFAQSALLFGDDIEGEEEEEQGDDETIVATTTRKTEEEDEEEEDEDEDDDEDDDQREDEELVDGKYGWSAFLC